MKPKFTRKYLYYSLTIMLGLCGAIAFYYLVFQSHDLLDNVKKIILIFMPIIDGFVVAYLLSPVLNFIETKILEVLLKKAGIVIDTAKKRKNIRFVSVFLTMLLAFLIIYCFAWMIIPQIVSSIKNLAYSVPDSLDKISIWIADLLKGYPYLEANAELWLDSLGNEAEKWLNGNLLPQLNSMLSHMNTILRALSTQVVRVLVIVWNLIIGIIISFYMLSSKEHFAAQAKKLVYALFKEKTANAIVEETRFIHKTFGGFITGKILDSFIIGCICFIVCSIMGTPYATLVSVIVGVTNIIPFFGPYLGAVPSALIILLADPKQCLYFIIFILILQQIDGNIIGPKILGDSTGLSGFWVIFAITLFGGLFGILGMFIGVPVFAVLYSALKRFCNRQLKRKKLPVSTNAYTHLARVRDGKLMLGDKIIEPEDGSDGPVKITKVTIEVQENDAAEEINKIDEETNKIDEETKADEDSDKK